MAETTAKAAEPEVDLTTLDHIITPDRGESDLIAILREAQDAYGYLPPAVLEAIAERLGVSWSTVYGVASFYEHFHLKPRGKHIIRVCRGTACHVRGATSILSAVERALGVRDGETTEDRLFTLTTVACLGTCSLAPVMMVDQNYYGKLTPDRVAPILEEYCEAAHAHREDTRA